MKRRPHAVWFMFLYVNHVLLTCCLGMVCPLLYQGMFGKCIKSKMMMFLQGIFLITGAYSIASVTAYLVLLLKVLPLHFATNIILLV